MAASTKVKKKTLSGFCNENGKPGQHEGTKPKSSSGAPMVVCTLWEDCACKCHADITAMYEMAGIPREEPEQSPEYHAWVRSQRDLFSYPEGHELDTLGGLSYPDGTDAPDNDEGTSTVPVRAGNDPLSAPAPRPAQPVFAPTPTGRRARGQLEYDVLQICMEFADNVYEWEYCTPKLIAERIAKLNGTEPPSTGAINAVWDRWEKLGFATQDKKPSRFVKFIPEVVSANVLDRMKSGAKRDKKRNQAEAQRTLRPRARR